MEYYDLPAFLRKASDDLPHPQTSARTPETYANWESEFRASLPATTGPCSAGSPGEFVNNLLSTLGTFLNFGALPDSIEELTGFGLPENIGNALNYFVDEQITERHVVGAFLMALMQSPTLESRFARSLKRLILGYWQRCGGQASLLDEVKSCMSGVTTNDWSGFVHAVESLTHGAVV